MRPGSIFYIAGALVVMLSVTAAGCSKAPSKSVPESLPAAPTTTGNAPLQSAALNYWQQKFPHYQLVTWTPAFLNGAGGEDAVVIYRTGSKCYLVAVLDLPDGFQVTDPLPAPVSDQQITVGDVQDKNPNEIIVSGEKNAAYGYAIYSLENNQLLTIYSAGMDQCC